MGLFDAEDYCDRQAARCQDCTGDGHNQLPVDGLALFFMASSRIRGIRIDFDWFIGHSVDFDGLNKEDEEADRPNQSNSGANCYCNDFRSVRL